jgi:hypothetical protein
MFTGPHTLEESILLREDVLESEVDALGATDGVRIDQVSGDKDEDLGDKHAGLHLESGLVHALRDLELPHHRVVRDLLRDRRRQRAIRRVSHPRRRARQRRLRRGRAAAAPRSLPTAATRRPSYAGTPCESGEAPCADALIAVTAAG